MTDSPLVRGEPCVRFLAGIPVITPSGQRLGALCVLDRVPRPLSPEQADALRALARQAANLLELGRYATEKERVEPVMVERVPLSALGSDISLALIRGDDLRVILQRCVEAVVRRLDVAFARIWTLEPGGDVLELRASAGLYTHLDGPHARVPLGCFKIGRIALENHPHLTNDVLHDSWVGDPEWARREGMVAFAGYPLAVEDRVVGVMAAFAYRPLPQAALEALGSISDAIAQCIERKRAEAELRRAHAELEERVRERTAELAAINRTLRAEVAERARAEEELRRAHEHLEERVRERTAELERAVAALHAEVAERRRVEQELRDSERRYRFLADTMPQIVWTARPDGELDYFNRRWFDYTGMTFEQTRGWGWELVLHPDDLQDCLDRWTHALRTGECYEIEHRFKRAADGADRWHLGRAEPMRDEAGAIVQWVGTSTDIDDQKRAEAALWRAHHELEKRVRERTAELERANSSLVEEIAERQRAERALRESEEKFRQIAENLGEVVWMSNPATSQLLYINPSYEKIWGCTCQSLYEQPLSFLQAIHPEDRPRILAALPDVEFKGRFDEELRIARPDGSVSWVWARAFPIRDAAGHLYRIVGIAQDITERMRAEEMVEDARRAAEAATRAKSEFLANMSHEIRTPMNGILGMTELALDTELSPRQREYLDLVKGSAEALLTIINDILDFSKIEAGKLDLDPVPFALRATIEDTVRALAVRAHAKGLELACRIAPGVPDDLVGDPDRLRQVLVNLIGNALKFTELGEVVASLETDAPGEGDAGEVALHVAVADTGVGIPTEKQRAIFEPFEQADGSTTRRYGGTGLGLAISARLVGLMGGRIWLESEPGRGSTFHFTARLGRSLDRSARPGGGGPPWLEGLPVLVVDDNATNRRILEEILSNWRARPATVDGGLAALEALRAAAGRGTPFAAALIDGMMPGWDGFDLAERVRAEPEIAGTVLLMLTSVGRDDPERSRRLGIAACLSKPVRQSELFDALMRALDLEGEHAPNPQHGVRETRPAAPPVACSLRILLAEDHVVNQKVAVRMLEGLGHAVTIVGDGLRRSRPSRPAASTSC